MAGVRRDPTQTITDSNVDHTQKSTSIQLQFLEQEPRNDDLSGKGAKQWVDYPTQAGTNAQHRDAANFAQKRMENQLSSAKKRKDQGVLEDDDFDVRRVPADAGAPGEGAGGLEFKADREAAKERSRMVD